MTKNVQPLTVLVTRPDPAGSALCDFLAARQFNTIHLPTIDFVAPPDPEKFREQVAILGDMDWLIFVSPHAVTASIPTIRQRWPIFPPNVKFAAVGEGTANALKAAGYTAIYPAHFNSEGLLNLAEFRSIENNQIAIIKGVGGRELLESELTARGAKVTPVIVYQRILPEIDITSYVVLLKQNKIDVIICTSFDAVQNLKRLFASENWYLLKNIPLVVISERIKLLAEALGFQTIWVAQNAKHESILDVLEGMKHGRPDFNR